MLPFNVEFQTGESKITQIRLSVLLMDNTLLNLTEEDVLLGGFTRDSSTTVDGVFTIGAAVTGKITVSIDNSREQYSAYDFRGAIITASLGGQLSDGTYQLVQVGIYTVDEYTYDGSNITLTAYDNLYKFDVPCKNTTVTFPQTISQLISTACTVAGVSLANASIPNGSYSVTKRPEQWDTMTWHDVISSCAQIACCFAKILPNGRLYFSWYNTSIFDDAQLDGGTFYTETTPYSDGATADGGDFTYTDTSVIDGGHFGDRDDAHLIGSMFDLTVDTDDILITGVSVSLSPTDNINATETTTEYVKTLGSSGYIIRIDNNPLIETTSNADSVCSYLYNYIVGMRFRPLSSSILENPSAEAGDVAIVQDRYQNTYYCFLSHVTYTTGAATSISCDAESTFQNLRARYSESQKTRALAQRTFERSVIDADAMMQMIVSAYATTMGLYQYTQSDGQGGTIYIYGNKNTLASSDIRWKFSAGALMVSSDYGAHWNAAISSEGIAVFQEVYAIKINADNIVAGTITGRTISGGTITGTTISGGLINTPNITMYQEGEEYSLQNGIVFYALSNGSYYKSVILMPQGVMSAKTPNSTTEWNKISELRNGCIYFSYGYVTDYNWSSDQKRTTYIYADDHISGISDTQSIDFTLRRVIVKCGWYVIMTIGYEYINVLGETTARQGIWTHELWADNLFVSGTKSKIVKTDYGDRLAYCYEMASPVYGDIGSAVIDEDGEVLVYIDPIFQEYIHEKCEYYVFLQNEGRGESYVSQKTSSYFVISGTPGLKVAWELKGKQADSYWNRTEEFLNKQDDVLDNTLYDEEAYDYVMEYLNTGLSEVQE